MTAQSALERLTAWLAQYRRGPTFYALTNGDDLAKALAVCEAAQAYIEAGHSASEHYVSIRKALKALTEPSP